MNKNYSLLLKNCCGADDVNISLVHSHILYELYNQSNPSMQQIAEILGVDITTFSRQIQTLIKEDLVMKSPNPDDKRIYFLSLTEKGKQTAERIDICMKEKLANLFSQLSDFERSTVIHSLNAVAKII
jgi:DNA-binding MarR family transcriptional regulator